MKNHFLILRLVLTYIFFAGVYIIYSDNLLEAFVQDVVQLTYYQSLKGWAFVILSGVLFGFLMFRELKNFEKLENEFELLTKQNELIFDDSLMPMIIIDMKGIIQKVNTATSDLLEHSDLLLKKIELQQLVKLEQAGIISQKIFELIDSDKNNSIFDLSLVNSTGKDINFKTKITKIKSQNTLDLNFLLNLEIK